MVTRENPGSRDATLVDAMILIGAIAVGLSAHRPMSSTPRWDFWPRAVMLPSAATWTVALLLIHLRQPHPPLSRLSRRPGWVACVAGVCGISIALLDRVTRLLLVFGEYGFDSKRFLTHFRFPHWGEVFKDNLFSMDFIQVHYLATAIAGAWITLAVSGRWRSDAGWLDLLGRATGIFWLVCMPSLWILQDWAEIR